MIQSKKLKFHGRDPGLATVLAFVFPPLGFVYLPVFPAALICLIIDAALAGWVYSVIDGRAQALARMSAFGRPDVFWSAEATASVVIAAGAALVIRLVSAWIIKEEAEDRAADDHKLFLQQLRDVTNEEKERDAS